MAGLVFGTAVAVSIIGAVWFAMRWDPAPADYPAEYGDGED